MNNDRSKANTIHESFEEKNLQDIQLGPETVLWALALNIMNKTRNANTDCYFREAQDKIQVISSDSKDKSSENTQKQLLSNSLIQLDGTFDVTKCFPSTWKILPEKNGYLHVPSGFTFKTNTFPFHKMSANQMKMLCHSILVHITLVTGPGFNNQKSLIQAIFNEIESIQNDEKQLFQSIENDIAKEAKANTISSSQRKVSEMCHHKGKKIEPHENKNNGKEKYSFPSQEIKPINQNNLHLELKGKIKDILTSSKNHTESPVSPSGNVDCNSAMMNRSNSSNLFENDQPSSSTAASSFSTMAHPNAPILSKQIENNLSTSAQDYNLNSNGKMLQQNSLSKDSKNSTKNNSSTDTRFSTSDELKSSSTITLSKESFSKDKSFLSRSNVALASNFSEKSVQISTVHPITTPVSSRHIASDVPIQSKLSEKNIVLQTNISQRSTILDHKLIANNIVKSESTNSNPNFIENLKTSCQNMTNTVHAPAKSSAKSMSETISNLSPSTTSTKEVQNSNRIQESIDKNIEKNIKQSSGMFRSSSSKEPKTLGQEHTPIEIDLDDDKEQNNIEKPNKQQANKKSLEKTNVDSRREKRSYDAKNGNNIDAMPPRKKKSNNLRNNQNDKNGKCDMDIHQINTTTTLLKRNPTSANEVRQHVINATMNPGSNNNRVQFVNSHFQRKRSTESGNGIILKRLWPDSTIFVKKILRWIPPELLIQKNSKISFKGELRSSLGQVTGALPKNYRDSADMVQKFSPFLLEEGRVLINQEYNECKSSDGIWDREVISMQLVSCLPVEAKSVNSASGLKTYEFAFRFPKGKDPPQSLGEMFVVHCDKWVTSKTCLGVKGFNDQHTMFLKDQQYAEDFTLFKIWICVAAGHHSNTGWLAQSDLPTRNLDGSFQPQMMHILNLGTVAPIIREFEGIKAISHLRKHIKNSIFCDKLPNEAADQQNASTNDDIPQTFAKNTKPSSIPSGIWTNLTKSLNSYQIAGIRKCITGKAKENFLLLQGPPGTGKTTTIVGLVSLLLQSTCPEPNGKVGGTIIRVGAVADDSNLNAVRSRILVCAPSNTAVDELAWRIHRGSIGPNGQKSGFSIIRFGACAGEHRHDGRKRGRVHSANTKREKFLRRINLDLDIELQSPERDLDFNDKGQPYSNNRRARHLNYGQERRSKLEKCHVVCTTLSSAGSKAFIDAVARKETNSSNNLTSEFDAVIIDEACQASEASSLIPLKFNPTCVVLVGDPMQLPVTVLSQSAKRANYGRSLFQRLQENGWPVDMLRTQYRMHNEISDFPSREFYQKRLLTDPIVHNRAPAQWYEHRCFPPFLVWNCKTLMEKDRCGLFMNHGEVEMVVRLLNEFECHYHHLKSVQIGIISFYSHQATRLQWAVNKRIKKLKTQIQISTVDGFQGCEKDIIILSCTRSFVRGQNEHHQPGIGFLEDHRRLNVALTRARQSLWIVGNCEILSHGLFWKKLLDDAANRYLIAGTKAFKVLCDNKLDEGPTLKKKSKEGKRKE